MTLNITYISDTDLLAQISQGDKLAFGTLYERYLDRIYSHAYYRLNDTADAEDVTEIVFLKAWQALSSRKKRVEVRNFRAWLYRIAHNEIIQHYRLQKEIVSIDQVVNLSDQKSSLEADVQMAQENELLANAISKLEPKYQQVIVCRFIDQLSHSEVAEIMKLKTEHVRVLQFRALKKLESILTEDD